MPNIKVLLGFGIPDDFIWERISEIWEDTVKGSGRFAKKSEIPTQSGSEVNDWTSFNKDTYWLEEKLVAWKKIRATAVEEGASGGRMILFVNTKITRR